MAIPRLNANALILSLLITTSACERDRKQVFPGYTYVGSDSTQTGFVDVQSVQFSEDNVSFSFISQRSNGQYAIFTISTDCSDHFLQMGGTLYSRNGSILSGIPADHQLVALSEHAVISAAAGKACGYPIVHVPPVNDDFDIASALRVYGDYDPNSQTALWEGITIPPDRPEVVNFRGVSKGTVGVAFSTSYKELGVGKHMVVTWTKPINDKYDCHACWPLLGILVFSKRAGNWTVESEERCLLLGTPFGMLPRFQLVRIGPEKFGLVMHYSDMHQGFQTAWIVVVSANGNAVRSILTLGTLQEPNDAFCSRATAADESCTHYTTGYRFVPGSNPDYFDLVVTKKILSGRSTGSEQRTSFTFVGNKFVCQPLHRDK